MTSPKTRGRMLNKDISDSKGFARLSPEAAVLFCMMIPHLSPYGKMNGDPCFIKGEVCPRIPYITVRKIPRLLEEISRSTNVKWFPVDGRWWIHSTKFLTDHQNLKQDKMGKDQLPNYSGPIPECNNDTPELRPPEVEVEVEVEVEGEVRRRSIARSRDELATMPTKGNGRKSYPISWNDKELKLVGFTQEMVDRWSAAFPAVDVEREIIKANEWVATNPTKRKKNYGRFIVSWLSRAQERGGTR
jgi:hypothetical protein